MAEQKSDKPTVENRWWAEVGKPQEAARPKPPTVAVGERFYKIAAGYDQDRARDNLTDQNLRLLHQANPAEGEWAYIGLLAEKFPEKDLVRVKQAVELPPYARGAVIDSGKTVRLLVTGTPVGERVLELALVEPPSFDCWVKNEWVREELYDNSRNALRAFRSLIREYLSPEALADFETRRARA